MPVWKTRDLGSTRGLCPSCRQPADLHLKESGYRRRWHELLLRRGVDDRVDRRVTCSACRRTYPVPATYSLPAA